MFGSCKDVVSAEIPVLLEQILEKIRKTNKKKDFCLVLAEDGVAWLKENCPEAHDLLIEFLKKHSHRAFVEVIQTTYRICFPNLILSYSLSHNYYSV